MAEILGRYLQAQAAATFAHGAVDCATLCIGWLDLLTGRNGLSAWLGRYSDAVSCQDFIASGGGHQAIAEQFLTQTYGLAEASSPVTGNIVLAQVLGQHAFGIRISPTAAAFRTPRGLLATHRIKVLSEWTWQQ